MPRLVRSSLLLAMLVTCCMAAVACAGPTMNTLSPRALRSGGSTTLAITGTNLLPAPRLLANLPGMTQTVRPGATAKKVEFEINLTADVPAGFYQLRLANESGVSSPQIVAVDALPQLVHTESATALPVALHGDVTGSKIARTFLEGKAGQKLVADVEARRLGSSLNPVVRLYDERGVQLAYDQNQASLGGDARLSAVLPADGKYTVEVHDALYRGAAPGFFRLKLGDLHYADLVFPLGVQQGTKQMLEFVSSNLPPETRTEFAALVPSRAIPVPWPSAERLVAGRPWVVVGALPEFVEGTSDGAVAAPVALNGRLSKPGEVDKYNLRVKPGMKLRLEMFAARAGSPVDGVLTIRNTQGGQLATSDDRPTTTDPGLEFTVPAGVNEIIAEAKDLLGRGGASFVYRISVADGAEPDFQITVQEDRIEIPQGGTTLIRVQAKRTAYNGPIQIAVQGLPEGVTLSGAEIPAGASDALISFNASNVSLQQSLVQMLGSSAGRQVERLAEYPEKPATRMQPWLSTELAAAVTPPAAIQLAWEGSSEGVLSLGGSMNVEVRATRRDKAVGSIRLSLISTQTTPKKNVGPQQVDDLERALRLDGTPIMGADASETLARILIPGDLPVISYDLALRGELLSADGKNVLATAVTPARRFVPVKPSFKLELAGEPRLQARAGGGETGRLVGKLIRSQGFDQNVTLTLEGLPKGLAAPKHIVSGERSDFAFPITFPLGTPEGDLSGVKLVATSQINAKSTIKAENEIAVTLAVVAGDAVMPEQPLAVFEDQSEFVANLASGSGTQLASEVKYSGAACVRVKPDQPGKPSIESMNYRIRQYPGPGEYRYLRFVWRKEGGKSICLQLGHDGKFGPVPGKRGSFRYHSGPGPECFGASELVQNKIPTEFTVVTRDLFADFGEFTLTGLGLAAIDGNAALFDHIYLARKPEDLKLVEPK